MTFFEKIFSTKAKLFVGSTESRDRTLLYEHVILTEAEENYLFRGVYLHGHVTTHGSRDKEWEICNKLNTQVRLLLFKECDVRGRKVLFDSETIERVKAGKDEKPSKQTTVPCTVEVTNGYSYTYKGPSKDTSVLGEMIFGAVAVNHKGVALKIHIMDELKRLMCTKVFSIPSSRRICRADRRNSASDRCDVQTDKSDKSEVQSDKSDRCDVQTDKSDRCDVQTDKSERSDTKPVNVPRRDDLSFNFSFDRGDSGFYGEQSVHSSVSSTCEFFNIYDTQDGTRDDFYSFNSPPGRKLSSCSTGSWQRRTFRSLCNKFDFGHSSHLLNVPTSESQIYSNSSASGTSDSLSSGGSASLRRSKLGLALLITVQDDNQRNMIRECLEHSVQLESLVCRLRLATLKAGGGNQFVHTLYNAARDAEVWVRDLVSGPRLTSMWTSITTVRHSAADVFLADLCSLLAAADTKHTNFFMSTLLTHLLTYHLGWVTTVSPYDVHPHSATDDDPPQPYNALWAQLHDLCGTIGNPPKSAKTVIYGTRNAHLMKKLLLVLTYFMRCGDVERMQFKFNDQAIQPELASEVKESEMKRNFTQKLLVNSETEISRSSDTLTHVKQVKSNTFSDISDKTVYNVKANCSTCKDKPNVSRLKKSPSQFILSSSSSSLDSDELEQEKKVVFVLGDNEKLVGLKNKCSDGKRVKKSSKIHNEPVNLAELTESNEEKSSRCKDSPSRCCSQTSQHSKPMKHSGFKFEFDKYPQIVINYMKSKNLEILDRHLIGKPGNLKLDNYLFDPSFVAPIQEEKCESCNKCEQMESIMQTPTNASEFEYMNDVPRITEPQYAKETLSSGVSEEPKTFIRKHVENTVIVNVTKPGISVEVVEEEKIAGSPVNDVVEFGEVELEGSGSAPAGFDHTLLGGVTDHYVPDYILQGVLGEPSRWESEMRRDLELTTYLNKTLDSPIQAVAIVGDIDKWEVCVESGSGRSVGGMSELVGAVLDTLPALLTAHVPTQQCISFVESKLREFCVLSKTLADLLMTKDFCDIETLTRSLNIDVNDVPLLMAVATTHTPQVARRYGISYR